MRQTILLLLVWGSIFKASAQMPVGSDTLYGNEWINYGQPYYKIQIANNGIYRIPSTMLPINSVPANRYQIYHNGKRIPVYTTTQGIPTANDYIEFYGQKNTNAIDSFMYKYGSISQLNPDYSVISDTSAYFLTWSNAVNPEVYTPTPNTLTNLPPKETYFMYDWRNEYHNSYLKPALGDVYVPEYGKGEGYSSGWAVNRTLNLTPPALYAGQSGTLTFRMLKDEGTHYTKIDINGSNVHHDTTSHGYIYKVFDFPLNVVGNSVQLDIKGQFTASYDLYDWHTIGHLQLRYARKFDFENKKLFEFTLPAVAYVKYLEIENFNHEGVAPILYDVTNKVRIETTLLNGKVAIALPPVSGATVRQFVLVNASTGRNNITELSRTEFEDLRFSNSDYIIISHPKLYDDGQGHNYVQQYADYRGTQEGGAYRPKIVNIQQLYEQFGYGINRHPIAIRNFTNFIQKNWRNPEPPKYLFILGKGRESYVIREHGILSDPAKQSFMIPTWGFPGSDNLLAGNHNSNGPSIPVGRLAATSGKQVQIYLEKIKGLEGNLRTQPQTLETRTWMKNILHLSGGTVEAVLLKNYLNTMRDSIQVSPLGLNVTSFYRTSTGPLQTSQTKEVFSYINKGLSLITFFGHSAPSTLEYNINEPNQFNNEGKYPSILALGCASGNVHTDQHNSVSEDIVFYERKGAIALSAASGSAYDAPLNTFCERYYKILGNGASLGLGDYAQRTIQQLDRSADESLRSVMQEFTLHGDPALRLFRLPAPDYVPDGTTVRFQPEVLTTRLDSFNLQLNISNIGSYQRDSMMVLIQQTLPSGVVKTDSVKVRTPPYSEIYTFRLPMLKEALGKNTFYIKVDAKDQIAEGPAGAEANNELIINNIYISDNNAYIVYPQPFAIVNESKITLKASTSNAITNNRKYLMEFDTTQFFNSPFKQKVQINSIGGLLEWAPSITWQPNTVYYWRVSPDSVDAYGYTWQTASFIYLPQASTGWNQSHYFQYLNNGFTTMNVRPYNRTFQYVNDTRTVNVKNRAGVGGNGLNVFLNSVYAGRAYGGGEMRENIEPTINVYVFDSISLNAWRRTNPQYNYGLTHSRFDLGLFLFNTSNDDSLTGRASLIKFLNQVPNNNYVVLATAQINATTSYYPELWGNSSSAGGSLLQVLENEGATQVRNMIQKPFPYIFAYQKGVGKVAERLADSLTHGLDENFVFTGRWYEGKMQSERIGPALSWDSLALPAPIYPAYKIHSFSLYGIGADGTRTALADSNLTVGKSLRHISPIDYPYLQLEWKSYDSTDRTPVHLDYWRIFYKGLPDVGFNASRHYKITADSVEKGDKVNIQIAIENTR
jgi:Peptidase family C25